MNDSNHEGLDRREVYRALVRDAYLQVADNLVFRILLVIVLVLVLLTFAVGFKEDRVDFLFGLMSTSYSKFLGTMGFLFPVVGGTSPRDAIVEGFQSLFTQAIAGSFGVFIAVVATGFFVPRMLEKGAADTLFSKPVSRGLLVISRYFASVLFVGLLSVVLVGGMYAGFAVSSGYTNPRFLWSAPMLIYLFAILAAFSTFFGALTRSSVATLLLTIVSWIGLSGVHNIWMFMDYAQEHEVLGKGEEPGPIQTAFHRAFTVAHLVLPKTNDSAHLTELLRKRVTREERRLLGGVPIGDDAAPLYRQLDGTVALQNPYGQNEVVFEPDGERRTRTVVAGTVVYLEISPDDVAVWTAARRTDSRERDRVEDEAKAAGLEEPELSWPPTWAQSVSLVPADEVDVTGGNPVTSYVRRFTWSQQRLGYSPLYSLGSSIVFCVLLVLGAMWRVRRIDF
ncbi:MAG: ABC transporter permease [Planctomycetota bacterium]